MKCGKCQFENLGDMNFCGYYYTSLEAVSPNCNFSNPRHFTFAGTCGRKLTSPEHGRYPKDLSFDEKLAKIQEYLPLKKAETMFRDMDTDYWLGKTQRLLARLGDFLIKRGSASKA